MKTKVLVLLFFLLFPQLLSNTFCIQNEGSKRRQIGSKFTTGAIKTRSPELAATGYWESGSLFLFFNCYFDGSKVCITDAETGVVVYNNCVTGNSLVVPCIDEYSSIFRIDIVNGNMKVSGEIYFN